MRTHVSLGYRQGFDEVAAWLRRESFENPNLCHSPGAGTGFWIIVTGSPELAKWQQEQLDNGCRILAGFGALEVLPEHGVVGISLECGDDAQQGIIELVKKTCTRFPGWIAHDGDSDASFTDLQALIDS